MSDSQAELDFELKSTDELSPDRSKADNDQVSSFGLSQSLFCIKCGKTFEFQSFLKRHMSKCKIDKESSQPYLDLKLKFDSLQEEFNRLATQNSNLSLISQQTNKELHTIKTELKNSNAAKDRLEKVNFTLSNTNKDSKRDFDILTAKNNNLLTELASLKENFLQKEKEICGLQGEIKVLKSVIETKEEKIIENQNISLTLQLNQQINIDGKVNYKKVVENLPCVTSEDLDSLFKNLPIHSLDSIKAVTNYVSSQYLNKRVVCTDKARRTVAWKDENRKIIKDKNGSLLSKKVKRAGVENKDVLETLLHNFDDKIDQTNIGQLESINRKNDTVVAITKNNTSFEDEFAKSLISHTKHVKNFHTLPKAEVETFTKYIKAWCKAFSTQEKLDLTGFLYILFKDCFKIQPTFEPHNLVTLYTSCLNKTIVCFMDCCNCYFCNDAENITVDFKGNVTFNIIRLWLKQNMAPNALANNHYHCFAFTDDDIRDITNKDLFANTCLQTFYNFIH
jgi:hypothetical protein